MVKYCSVMDFEHFMKCFHIKTDNAIGWVGYVVWETNDHKRFFRILIPEMVIVCSLKGYFL